MKFYIITCAASAHILPATMHLLKKYGPEGVEYKLIDLGKNDITRWTLDIYEQLKHETDEHIVFSLDDYLPIDHWNQELLDWVFSGGAIIKPIEFNRFELGYGAQFNHSKDVQPPIWRVRNAYLLAYRKLSNYRVSCQTSIWKTETLLNLLKEKPRTPWQFEVESDIKDYILYSYGDYVFRWIEESALSKRHPGKINILGLRPADVEELISLGHLDPERLQYGMSKGHNPPYVPGQPIPIDPGPKYRQFYKS